MTFYHELNVLSFFVKSHKFMMYVIVVVVVAVVVIVIIATAAATTSTTISTLQALRVVQSPVIFLSIKV